MRQCSQSGGRCGCGVRAIPMIAVTDLRGTMIVVSVNDTPMRRVISSSEKNFGCSVIGRSP